MDLIGPPLEIQRRERFEKLIAYFERLLENEPTAFTLKHWFIGGFDGAEDEARRSWIQRAEAGEPLDCGTAACVVGHLPVIFPGEFTWEADNYLIKVMRGGVFMDQRTCSPAFGAPKRSAEAMLHEYLGGYGGAWSDVIHVRNYDTIDDNDDVPLTAVLTRLKALFKDTYGSGT